MHPSRDIPAHRLRAAQAAAETAPAKPKRVRKAKTKAKAKPPAKAKAAAKPPRALVDQLREKGK